MVLEIESLQTQIQRILQSKAFRTSEVQRNLLSYLADKSIAGTADNLKEYIVGLDVFGKPASYDPRQESTVRMHVGRLRQKLAEYYRTEGVDDPVVVDLPKGGFKITFEPRAVPPVPEVLHPAPVEVVKSNYRLEIALGTALLLAVLCAGYFGVKLWRVERRASGAGPRLDAGASEDLGADSDSEPPVADLHVDARIRHDRLGNRQRRFPAGTVSG